MDPVVADQHVYGTMDLDARYLGTLEYTSGPNIVNVIVIDLTEHRSQATDDTGLSTPEYFVVAYDMGSNLLLRPAFSGLCIQTLCPVPRSLPREIPTHFELLTVLFSMIQPLLQCVPISPGCSAVGAAHWVAACVIKKPLTAI